MALHSILTPTTAISLICLITTHQLTTRNKADGQHWTTVRELLMQKDKEQCESWKDEVQNVLIFSGLFSAIVTAFLIESQKDLRPDPTQESVQLLRQIAAQSARVEPRIDSSSICVNVFWFPGIHHSYIPLIFTSLPIILIFGLTFFIIGLIVFLFKIGWPVTCAIACTFTFLAITTALPALQLFPVYRSSDDPSCVPSPYRSPQSLLFLRRRDWVSRSDIWLRQHTQDFFHEKEVLSHLEHIPTFDAPKPFTYDTIKALISLKESRSAESKMERTALAKCLAEVLPIHLTLFPTDHLADLIPFLPPSESVPSVVFLQDSATPEDLSAVAYLQIATCKGRPSQIAALVTACVNTTRWLFERPYLGFNSQ